jgi:hypothetical protein
VAVERDGQAGLPLAELLACFPVALLERVADVEAPAATTSRKAFSR